VIDWAVVIDAQVMWKSGRTEMARARLQSLIENAQSGHARQAAMALLEQLGKSE
jgi:hypothetical protein